MKKLLFTANLGNLYYAKFTLPSIRAYAHKIGAELVVLTTTKRPRPHHVFFDAIEYAMTHNPGGVNAWVDLDVIIRPWAPDVFKKYDCSLCIWAARPISQRGNWRKKFGRFNKKPGGGHLVPDIDPYFSTGLVIWNSELGANIWEAGGKRLDWPPVGDQEIFNLLWRRAGVCVRYIQNRTHYVAKKLRRYNQSFVHCHREKRKRKNMRAIARYVYRLDHPPQEKKP